MTDRMLGIKEAAWIAGVSYPTMLRAASTGALPFSRVLGRWAISESRLCAALGLDPRFGGAPAKAVVRNG